MIWFDGEKWSPYKYKYKETIIGYTDSKVGYSEGTRFEENILSKEQSLRLKDIENVEMTDKEAIDYINGIGEIPDNRSEEQRLIDLVLELDPRQANSKEVLEGAFTWYPGIVLDRFTYVSFENKLYKALHPIRSHDLEPPNTSPLYLAVGKEDDKEGLEEITASSEHLYKKGFIGAYQGRKYESNYDNNGNPPFPGSKYPDWWTDLGEIGE